MKKLELKDLLRLENVSKDDNKDDSFLLVLFLLVITVGVIMKIYGYIMVN